MVSATVNNLTSSNAGNSADSVDVGTVLYENKNDQNIKAFLVEKDPIQWDEILNRCFRIQEMLMPPEKCSGATWCNCRKVENY